MKKEILVVPKGIRYISEWSKLNGGYSLNKYQYPHIVDKKLTGCGFTEYCLTCDQDVIVCSPRKILLENKKDQHYDDVFYFKVDEITDEVDQFVDQLDASAKKQRKDKRRAEMKDQIMLEKKFNNLRKALINYLQYRKLNLNRPAKILVTYDSFHYVRKFIEDSGFLVNDFYIVVDEFQSIFVDSKFKSSTELGFLTSLSGISKLCFVSATPMLDKYLDMLDEFKDLPFVEFDWKTKDTLRVIKPSITLKYSDRLLVDAKYIVDTYLNGNFSKFYYRDSDNNLNFIESKEAVLYFNSVQNICSLIKKCGLTPENTNVLCANTPENQISVKKAFKLSCGTKDGKIGTLPTIGEPHKMFTLCTRTVYLGADFYSTCARTFVFSSPNIDSLAVDISLDLPQILGRQRLDCNPWKNSAILYYSVSPEGKSISQESFDLMVSNKIKRTKSLMKLFDSAPTREDRAIALDSFKDAIVVNHYKKDYLAMNIDSYGNLIPVLNNLVMVSEMRAYEIQQIDYKDRFSVFNCVGELTDPDTFYLDSEIKKHLEIIDSFSRFRDKLRYVCELADRMGGVDCIGGLLSNLPTDFRSYVLSLGPDRCRSLSYCKSDLDKELNRILGCRGIDISAEVYCRFKPGNKYTYIDIKAIFSSIYRDNSLDISAKATDINRFFNTRTTQVSIKDSVTGKVKRVGAFEILSVK